MARPASVRIVEVGPRDGLQNEPGIVPLAAKVALTARVIRTANRLTVFVRGGEHTVEFIDPRLASQAATGTAGRLVAPMPGTIIRIAVEEGQEVTKGAALVVVEAMKMEHTVAAPRDGRIKALKFAVGDLVDEGAELLVLEDA